MAGTIDIKLVTLEKTTYQGLVEKISLPTYVGMITVLPGHQPLVGLLVPGTMTIVASGETQTFAITTGFFEIVPGNRVRVLADTADNVDDLDIEAITKSKALVESSLKEENLNDYEIAYLEDVLSREVARLRLAEEYRANL